jgi:hypothetical protein
LRGGDAPICRGGVWECGAAEGADDGGGGGLGRRWWCSRCLWPARDEDGGWRWGQGRTDAALRRDSGNNGVGGLRGAGGHGISPLREARCWGRLSVGCS